MDFWDKPQKKHKDDAFVTWGAAFFIKNFLDIPKLQTSPSLPSSAAKKMKNDPVTYQTPRVVGSWGPVVAPATRLYRNS